MDLVLWLPNPTPWQSDSRSWRFDLRSWRADLIVELEEEEQGAAEDEEQHGERRKKRNKSSDERMSKAALRRWLWTETRRGTEGATTGQAQLGQSERDSIRSGERCDEGERSFRWVHGRERGK